MMSPHTRGLAIIPASRTAPIIPRPIPMPTILAAFAQTAQGLHCAMLQLPSECQIPVPLSNRVTHHTIKPDGCDKAREYGHYEGAQKHSHQLSVALGEDS